MLFTPNKYTTWYYSIINRAMLLNTIADTYYEKHHIIPKSLGGSNQKTNLVKLTPREHFVCHLLLTKMTSGQAKHKMQFALIMLSDIKNIGAGRYTPSSRLYEYAKKSAAQAREAFWTPEQRKKKSEQGKLLTHREDSIEKIRDFQKNNKVWTEKALANLKAIGIKSAATRKGSKWTADHRQARMTTYVDKNLEIATKIIALADTGLNKLTIAKTLGVSWEKVKYSLLHRAEFEARLAS